MTTQPAAIAVVGMACHYPGARTPRELWENVLGRREQFRAFLEERMPARDYHDADPSAPDKTYGSQGAFIDGFRFDPSAWRVPRASFLSTDIAHWLALEVAANALADAGFPAGDGLPRERTSVIVGNSLTGEQARANSLRLRWPFVRRLVDAELRRHMPADDAHAAVEAIGERYRGHFPATSEDTLAGALSNTIAGRICGMFDLGGGGYVVDGACASSMLAVCTAAGALEDGRADVVVAGGVDISMDPFELVGFAKAKALAPGDMRVYDRRGNGFIPGEGSGFVVLQRLADARAAGRPVYAILEGWGVSSDGRNAITAPKVAGQARAIRAAWARSGVPDFVEGHGTGTALGDKVELEAIAQVCDGAAPRAVGVTSLKSILGHTKAAAGIGAFLKAVVAVNRRVLPPTSGCADPNPVFDAAARALYPVLRGEVRPADSVLRAGASAMGFGGINTHAVVRSGDAPDPRLAPSLPEAALLVSQQEVELFVFGATDLADLRAQVRALIPVAGRCSRAELVDLSAERIGRLKPGLVRAAVIAGSPKELLARLERLLGLDHADGPDVWLDTPRGAPRIGFVCPGQGSQRLESARVLLARDPALAAEAVRLADIAADAGCEGLLDTLFPSLDRAVSAEERAGFEARLAATELAQPALCLVTLLWARRLAALGLTPSVVAGHSLGELSAFALAGAIDADTLMRLAVARGAAMAGDPARPAGMVSLTTDRRTADGLCAAAPGYAAVANVNGPRQVVVAGDVAALDAIVVSAADAGISARRLPVSNAFHSALVADAAAHLSALDLGRTRTPVVTLLSTVRDGDLGNAALTEHVATHITRPVDFVALVERLAPHADLLVEVGSGRVLSGLVDAIGGPRCLPVEGTPGRAGDLAAVLASAWIRGADVRWGALHDGRLVRPFVAPADRVFLPNPCEVGRDVSIEAPYAAPFTMNGSPLPVAGGASPSQGGAPSTPVASAPAVRPDGGEALLAWMLDRVAEKTGFDKATLSGEQRLQEDLNLDSIKAGELVAAAARHVGVADRIDPAQYLRQPIDAIARSLGALGGEGGAAQPAPVGAEAAPRSALAEAAPVAPRTGARPDAGARAEPRARWVRTFGLSAVPVEDVATRDWSRARVRLLAPAAIADALGAALTAAGATIAADGADVVAVLDARATPDRVRELRAVVDAAAAARSLLVVQRIDGRFGVGAIGLTPDPAIGLTPDRDRAIGLTPDRDRAIGLTPDRDRPDPAPSTLRRGSRPPSTTGRGDPARGAGAAAFARSISLERPSLAVSLLDADARLDDRALVDAVVSARATAPGFTGAGVDTRGRWSLEARPLQPATFTPRKTGVTRGDLVLVTGGARGITAACAEALAKATGARLALVGSTPREKVDDTILHLLGRLALAGIEARYWSCDLADADAVAALIRDVRAAQGPIAAVVHGAGRNTPRRVEQVSAEAALAEIAPKLLGAEALLDALADAPPRLFVALTSIIGVSGMMGNAWYAFANESLDLAVADFGVRHGTAALSIAYGVWSDIGMGAKLGSVDALGRMGIGALSPDDGVARFLSVVLGDPGVRQPVVTAHVDGLPTWPARAVPIEGLRFLDGVRAGVVGVEARVQTVLHPDRDTWLRDHDFQGSLLLPTVFGLEAMAQAAVLARGGGEVRELRDIELPAPIVVGSEGTNVELRAHVSEEDPNVVTCELRTEQTGFAKAHFSATIVFGARVDEPAAPFPALPAPIPALEPRVDLYGGVLFQGPAFHRMGPITGGRGRALVFEGSERAPQEGRWILGDPFFRDALLQAGQVLVPQDDALPVRIARIGLGVPDVGTREVYATILATVGKRHIGAVEVRDADGRRCQWLEGYEVQILASHPGRPDADAIFRPTSEGANALLRGLGADLSAVGAASASQGEASACTLALHPWTDGLPVEVRRAAVSGLLGDVTPVWDAGGRPSAADGRGLSIAHDVGLCLIAVGEGAVGCDIEPIRPRADWAGLLGAERARLLPALRHEPADAAGTRVWVAGEALYKAGAGHAAPVFEGRDGDVVRFRSGEFRVVTSLYTPERGPRRMVAVAMGPARASAAVVMAAAVEPVAATPSAIDPSLLSVNLVGTRMCTRFVVSFDESGSVSGRVPAITLASWMGRLRELALAGLQAPLLAALASGRHGMVTQNGWVTLSGEAAALDRVEAAVWVEELRPSSCLLRFRFDRIDGAHRTLIGEAAQRFGWVEVVGHGQVRSADFPPFLYTFLDAIHERTTTVAPRPLLLPTIAAVASAAFTTTLVEGNVVGNLYYAHYFKWAQRVVDQLVWRNAPEVLRARGELGELRVESLRVEYMREAMPFDTVEVSLHPATPEPGEADLAFDIVYSRPELDGSRTRLALGRISAAWCRWTAAGHHPAPAPAWTPRAVILETVL